MAKTYPDRTLETAASAAGCWPEPKITNPDIAQPTGIPYIDGLIHQLLDAQQDINLAANEQDSQTLADASSLLDEVEAALRTAAALVAPTAAPEQSAAVAKLREAIDEWPQFDAMTEPRRPGAVEESNEVNGGDLVEWFAIWRTQVKALLEAPPPEHSTSKVFMLSAEHFSVPGVVMQAHKTLESAVAEAVDLVNIMLRDSGKTGNATASDWEDAVEQLQDQHGAAHCYVEISETDLRG